METTILSKEQIQEYIKAHPNLSTHELANALGVCERTIRGNKASLTKAMIKEKGLDILGDKEKERLLQQREYHKNRYLEMKILKFKKANQKKRGRKSRAERQAMLRNCTIGTLNIYNGVTADVEKAIEGNYKGNGFFKEQAKEKMQNHIIKTNIGGNIATLTNLYLDMETAIFNALPNTHYTVVEKDLSIFKQMKKKFKNSGLPIRYHNGLFSEVLYGKDENTYAHLIMDYCADLPSVAKELEYTIQKNLVGVGGIIALTTNRINRRGSGDMWDYITSLSDESTINRAKDSRSNTEIQNERFLYSILGRNYKIIEVFNYQDSYPMTLTIIQRIR